MSNSPTSPPSDQSRETDSSCDSTNTALEDDSVETANENKSIEESTGGVVLAVRGGIGFLTRLPVGTDQAAWESFRRWPVVFIPVGYLVGVFLGLSVVLPIPAPTVAVLFPVAIIAATGINHADGVADLGDAAVVHGDSSTDDDNDRNDNNNRNNSNDKNGTETRRRVLKDSQVGVGGTLALALLVAGLVFAGFSLAGVPAWQAFGIVVAAEVSAKFGMAMLACIGDAPFDGLGAQLTAVSDDRDLVAPVLGAIPVAVFSYPSMVAGVTLLAGVATAVVVWYWASEHLGGVNGDVFGATNELVRVVAVHAGVVAWTLL